MCCQMLHRLHQMFIIVFVFILFLANCLLHAFAVLDLDHIKINLFDNSPSTMDEKYRLLISPAEWTRVLWGAIYVLQLIWLIFALTTLCRKTEGGYLYFSPTLISSFVYVFFGLSLAANIAYLFMWDMEQLEISAAIMAGSCLFLYICLFLVMFGLNNSAGELLKQGKKSVIIDSVILSFNSFAATAAFVTIQTVMHAATTVQYVLDWDPNITATLALCIIALELFVYVLIDFAFFERHFRFVLTPYIVLGVVLAGIAMENWDLENQLTIIVILLIACTGFALLSKVIMAIAKACTQSVYGPAAGDDSSVNVYENGKTID